MNKATRLFKLADLFARNGQLTAERIESHLGVSRRTVYRYIDSLSEAGFPVYYDPDIASYRVCTETRRPDTQLRFDDASLLVCGMRVLRDYLADDYKEQTESLLSAIQNDYPELQLAPDTKQTEVSEDLLQLISKRLTFEILFVAVAKKREVSIMLKHPYTGARNRTISSPSMTFTNEWYLLDRSLPHEEPIAIDQIASARIINER